jgi:hypothetical protein
MIRRRLGAIALAAALAGCAHGGKAHSGGPSLSVGIAPVDSATVAVWRFDETGSTRAADSGPLRLDAHCGIDTRTEFGRIRGGRRFTLSVDSFAYVPVRPALDPMVGMTVELWVYPEELGQYELTPLAGRWGQQPGEQSWLLGLVGLNTSPQFAPLPGPDYLGYLVGRAAPGHIMFAFQPEDAGTPRSFVTTAEIPLQRWSHVAATFDGTVVRLYLDGRLDSQYAFTGGVRASRAPLLIGNYLDWRWLSEFGGDLRVTQGHDMNPYYAFVGVLDDLRLSDVARTSFPYVLGPELVPEGH